VRCIVPVWNARTVWCEVRALPLVGLRLQLLGDAPARRTVSRLRRIDPSGSRGGVPDASG